MCRPEAYAEGRRWIVRCENAQLPLTTQERMRFVAWIRRPGHKEVFLTTLAQTREVSPAAKAIITMLMRRVCSTTQDGVTFVPANPFAEGWPFDAVEVVEDKMPRASRWPV